MLKIEQHKREQDCKDQGKKIINWMVNFCEKATFKQRLFRTYKVNQINNYKWIH